MLGGTVVVMTTDRKERDKALNGVFMAVLKGALTDSRLDAKDVDARLDLSPGTTARWLRNDQIMRAPMFVAIADLTVDGPVKIFERGTARAKAAGLLDHVEVTPAPTDELARLRAEKERLADLAAAADERGEYPGAALEEVEDDDT